MGLRKHLLGTGGYEDGRNHTYYSCDQMDSLLGKNHGWELGQPDLATLMIRSLLQNLGILDLLGSCQKVTPAGTTEWADYGSWHRLSLTLADMQQEVGARFNSQGRKICLFKKVRELWRMEATLRRTMEKNVAWISV